MITIDKRKLVLAVHPHSSIDKATLINIINSCEIKNPSCEGCGMEPDCSMCSRDPQLEDLYSKPLTLEEKAVNVCIKMRKTQLIDRENIFIDDVCEIGRLLLLDGKGKIE